jgi:hypothetical protein
MLVDNPQVVQQYRVKASQRALMHYRWEDVIRSHADLYQRALNGKLLGAVKRIS